MNSFDRRQFLQVSAAALLATSDQGVADAESQPQEGTGQARKSESSYVRTGLDGKSWTIGNALVEREIRFDPNVGLYTAAWRHKVTGTDFVERARLRQRWGAEFIFQAD
jgi:hypothetical protein